MRQAQRELLLFMKSYTKEHGYPPTVREMGEFLHIEDYGSVTSRLATLINHNFVTIVEGERLRRYVPTLKDVPMEVDKNEDRVYPCSGCGTKTFATESTEDRYCSLCLRKLRAWREVKAMLSRIFLNNV